MLIYAGIILGMLGIKKHFGAISSAQLHVTYLRYVHMYQGQRKRHVGKTDVIFYYTHSVQF